MTKKLYDVAYLEKIDAFLSRTKERSYALLGTQSTDVVADFGCGIGLDAGRLSKSGARVYAIDNDCGFLAIAKERHPSNVHFIRAAVERIPMGDAVLDKARIDRVLQHVSDHERVLREVRRLL